ncbi:hypothetical protein GCM10009789_28580 [Kribbella sancticallisti]|uniref:Aminoglycoside phosphotransferase domain-containing protein n=1 Tax=Kribbella sancticallisti TaxID=460087 RepID=A0ABP4P9C2_9ACTN
MRTQHPPNSADVEAARLLLARLGISAADLLPTAGPKSAAPTFAEYIPTVSAAVGPGTRRVYTSYWNRLVRHWGSRRLDEPTPTEIQQLGETTKVRDAELIRIGSNAVFRFKAASVIGRVAPSLKRLDSASRELEVSWWLESEDIPAVRGLHLVQPITTNERIVTFWHSVSDKTDYGTTTELAQLLRQLHDRVPQIALPNHDPVAKARERISESDSLDSEDLEFLTSRLEELAAGYQDVKFELPGGIIHGDANVGNVLRDRSGTAVLADLDSVAWGHGNGT